MPWRKNSQIKTRSLPLFAVTNKQWPTKFRVINAHPDYQEERHGCRRNMHAGQCASPSPRRFSSYFSIGGIGGIWGQGEFGVRASLAIRGIWAGWPRVSNHPGPPGPSPTDPKSQILSRPVLADTMLNPDGRVRPRFWDSEAGNARLSETADDHTHDLVRQVLDVGLLQLISAQPTGNQRPIFGAALSPRVVVAAY